MRKILSYIGIVQLFIVIVYWVKWLHNQTDTKLFEPESLNHLHKADLYIKNKNK